MAKKNMTSEEKLEEAIVKNGPYEVPGNWGFVKLNYILSNNKNSLKRGPFGSAIKKDYFVPIGYKVYEQKNAIYNDMNLGDYFIDENKYKELEAFSVKPGDLIVSCSGTVGKIALIPEGAKEGIINQALLKIELNESIILNKYFMFLFISEPFISKIIDDSRGSAIKNIAGTKILKDVAVPLPPLKEQQRIVDRIESLFEKLDKAKELIEEAREGFEKRKVAILNKAVKGELTKDWRKKNSISLKNWEERSLKECGKWFGGGTPSKANNSFWNNGTINWITPKDMKYKIIEDSEVKITEEAINNSSVKYIEENALIFVVRSGILRRLLPIAMCYKGFTVNQDMKILVPCNIELEYLYWVCVSSETDIRNKCSKSGTTVESISTELLYQYLVKIPSIEEQKEIVKILDKLLEEEDKIEELTQLEGQIELIKKSILAKAFRGKLGTNCEEDENALELLEEILSKDI